MQGITRIMKNHEPHGIAPLLKPNQNGATRAP